MMKKMMVIERISDIFISLGIPAHIQGYHFLREATKLAVEDFEMVNHITKKLYLQVANRFGTSVSTVERSIRHAIEIAWNKGKITNINSIFGLNIYDKNEKPSGSELIALLADRILLECV